MICALLGESGASNFRLVCRAFSSIGLPFILREVTIRMNSADFEQLRLLAGDPTKSRHIQSLVYSVGVVHHEGPDVLAPWVVEQTPLVAVAVSKEWSTTEEQVLVEYNKIREDQHNIQHNSLDYDLLAGVLPNLPCLTSITIDNENWPRAPFRRRSTNNALTLCRVAANLLHPHAGAPGRRVLALLLKALEASNNTNLRALKAGRLAWRCIDNLLQARPRLDHFFSNLTELNLHFCMCRQFVVAGESSPERDDNRDAYYRWRENSALAGFLATLPSLESLAISFCHKNYPFTRGSIPWIGHVVRPGHHWPRLTTLSLGGMNLAPSQLLQLLADHKDTLRRLELFTVWLKGDDQWPLALAQMRETLSLEDAAIWHSILDNRGQWNLGSPREEAKELASAVRNYLVHGGPCPITVANRTPDRRGYHLDHCRGRSRY
jgi:hypothetical protein